MAAFPQLLRPAGALGRFTAAGGLALSLAAASPEVMAVRFFSHGEVTRVAIEVSGEFRLASDRLHNPDRAFFDIRGAGWRQSRKVQIIPVHDGRLKQIRVALTRPEITRVVLDLEPGFEAVASQLANPERLMIEVRRSDEPAARVLPQPAPSSPAPPAPVAPARAVRRFEPYAPPVVPPLVLDPPPPGPRRRAPRLSLALSAETAAALEASRTRPPAPLPPKASPPQVIAAPRTPEPPPATVAVRTPEPPAPAIEKAVPARTNAITGERSMTRVLGLKIGRVVIDAGHGGHDTGSIGPGGLMEKDLVLDVAKRLGALLEQKLSAEVFYTRTDDTFVPLESRADFANEKRADLFLSIHANSSPLKATAGSEVFYLNFTTSKADLEVAARENASSQKSVYELHDLLQKIALRDKVDESRDFAARVQKELFTLSSRANSKARNRGVKKAPFVVLIGASMPSVLAEVGFISNPREESQMNRPEHRQKIAEALFKGVSQYSGTLSHFQVAQRKP